MGRHSDLILDSKLDTRFESKFTVHIYREVATNSEGRVVERVEYWRPVCTIGAGASGSINLEDCEHGYRDVRVRAVKKILTRPRRGSSQIDYRRELGAIAKFSHDKYVHRFVKSFGWYEDENALFIAMEYLQHGDLDQYMSRSPPLLEEAARDITYQILEGVSYMHNNGYAHRDLKPGNILIVSCPPQKWWVKIGDFGISKRLEDGTSKSTLLKGTLGFIAPELHELASIGTPFAADMWSIGEISFQLMTKQPVFRSFGLLATFTIQNHCFPSTDLLAHGVSDLGQNFISSLMLPAPEKRLIAADALKHPWMAQYLSSAVQPTLLHQRSSDVSTTASNAEVLGSRNSISISKSSQHDVSETLGPRDQNYHSLDGDTLRPSTLEYVQGKAQTPEKKTYLRKLQGHSGGIYSVAFSPDGNKLASGSSDMSIRIWNAATGNQLRKLQGHSDRVCSVVFSPDGTTLASGSWDGSVRIWDAATGREVRKIIHAGKQWWKLQGNNDRVCSVAFSPNGTTLASSSWDRSVKIWDTATGRQLWELQGHNDRVNSVAFSPDGTILASCSLDESVRIWDAATGKQLEELRGHGHEINSVAFSSNGTTLASGSLDKSARIWDAATGKQLWELQGHDGEVFSVVFSPDGTKLASCSLDGSVRFWDVVTGKKLRNLQGHKKPVFSIAFSPDGAKLASSSRDESVRIWDATV